MKGVRAAFEWEYLNLNYLNFIFFCVGNYLLQTDLLAVAAVAGP